MTQNTAFGSLSLPAELLDNVSHLGYEAMTPVQAQGLPLILSGRDVIAQAETGSGKTVAFGLGILTRLDARQFNVQALVLCPTRELADQVAEELRRLAHRIPNVKILTLCGGSPVRNQVVSLEKGVHIIVGTPGRVEDHVKRQTLDLAKVHTLVLDEADRMLQMGFEESVDAILLTVPDTRQTLLLSATYPDSIRKIAERVMRDPAMIVVESPQADNRIEQRFYKVPEGEPRLEALRLLLQEHQPDSALVFCTRRTDVNEVASAMKRFGFSALPLHGDMEQRDRDQTLIRFANKSVTLLVATDVAARGLDIDSLDIVANYHFAGDVDVHMHRIGRTGRAGKGGLAWSFHDARDARKLDALEEHMGHSIDNAALPSRDVLNQPVPQARMVTIEINGGKKDKLRPGDVLGALTGENGIAGDQVGKIRIISNRTFVAVRRDAVKTALNKLGSDKLKGRSYRARAI